nr:hypothetical protein [Tanacetum cinerariifolium]
TQKFIDEIGELRAIFGHMLGAVRVQILENNLNNLYSLREEDETSETMDPQDIMGSLLLADIDLIILGLDVSVSRTLGCLRGTSVVVIILVQGHAYPTIVKVRPVGCDPLALLDGFTPIEDNIGCDPLALLDGFTPVEDNIDPSPSCRTTKVKVLKELPKVSMDRDVTTADKNDIIWLMASIGSLPCLNTRIVRSESSWGNSETDIVKLVVEIESFGMIFDDFDKETVSFDELQLKQVHLKVLMMDWLSIVETDKVIHTVETDIVKLVVEIESFGMIFDDFDKETVSFDELQLKQAHLSCVHALIELHLHEILVVPSKHEADQY